MKYKFLLTASLFSALLSAQEFPNDKLVPSHDEKNKTFTLGKTIFKDVKDFTYKASGTFGVANTVKFEAKLDHKFCKSIKGIYQYITTQSYRDKNNTHLSNTFVGDHKSGIFFIDTTKHKELEALEDKYIIYGYNHQHQYTRVIVNKECLEWIRERLKQ